MKWMTHILEHPVLQMYLPRHITRCEMLRVTAAVIDS